MKLTNAQVTRVAEALILAKYGWIDPAYEPQRGRIEALVDDILEVLKPKVCDLCGHPLENNSHGFDQNDAYMDGDKLVHSGHCTYCKYCTGNFEGFANAETTNHR